MTDLITDAEAIMTIMTWQLDQLRCCNLVNLRMLLYY